MNIWHITLRSIQRTPLTGHKIFGFCGNLATRNDFKHDHFQLSFYSKRNPNQSFLTAGHMCRSKMTYMGNVDMIKYHQIKHMNASSAFLNVCRWFHINANWTMLQYKWFGIIYFPWGKLYCLCWLILSLFMTQTCLSQHLAYYWSNLHLCGIKWP